MKRIVVPTPFPVGPVNVWVVEGDPLTLVDTGPCTDEALDTLEQGLAGLGLRMEDVELLVLSHQHSDHVGLAGTVAGRSGCAVAGNRLLVEYVRDVRAALEAEHAWQDDLLRLHGTPDALREEFLEVMRGRVGFGGSGVHVDRPLVEGDVVDAGGLRLRVAHRPGHSPTDTIFVDDATGTAIVGDHLIAHISSNPLAHRPLDGAADPTRRTSSLTAYLDSLARTAEEELTVLHPGHGLDVTDHRGLIAERVRMHERRVEQVRRALADGPTTASALSARLWRGLPASQTFLTLCEVLGALDLLEAEGAVTRSDGPPVVYAPA